MRSSSLVRPHAEQAADQQAHHLVDQGGDDATVGPARRALVGRTEGGHGDDLAVLAAHDDGVDSGLAEPSMGQSA